MRSPNDRHSNYWTPPMTIFDRRLCLMGTSCDRGRAAGSRYPGPLKTGSRRWWPLGSVGRRSIAAMSLAALGLLATGATSAAALKIATLSPEGSLWMKMLRDGGRQIEAGTEGRVSFKFYPGGVMGDDKAVLRKIRVGQLHGAVVTAGALVQTYPDIGLYSLPMAFRSGGEADYVRERMDVRLLKGLQDKGFVAFGIAEVGFAHAMSRAVITSVEDARALRVWVPDNDPGSARAFGAFGIAPIPLPIADVLAGLQTGLIDSVATPPVAAIALQWHTQLDHVMDLPMVYVYGLLAVARRSFEVLSQADQAVVQRVMGVVVDQVNARSRNDHEQASAALRNQGLDWHETLDAERQEWQKLADVASRRMVEEGFISAGAYQQMLEHLEAYRASGE